MTSVDNPLPVDPDTLYVLGSVTKTQTATALMRLVASGQVELEAPARRYVPDLRLKDEQAAFAIVDGPPVRGAFVRTAFRAARLARGVRGILCGSQPTREPVTHAGTSHAAVGDKTT